MSEQMHTKQLQVLKQFLVEVLDIMNWFMYIV